eukprot:3634710-Amphidinium_carterae.1
MVLGELGDTPTPNPLDAQSAPEFLEMLGSSLQARQEQRSCTWLEQPATGSGASSAPPVAPSPGRVCPSSERAPEGAREVDVVSVSDSEASPPGEAGTLEGAGPTSAVPTAPTAAASRTTLLTALADYYSRLSLWEDEANFVPHEQRGPPPVLAPELRELDAFARGVPLHDGPEAPRGGPLPNEATEALAARVRAASLERREELPEGLLADLDDYYQRLRLWEDEAGFVPAFRRTPAPDVSPALREFACTGLQRRGGGPDSRLLRPSWREWRQESRRPVWKKLGDSRRTSPRKQAPRRRLLLQS